MKKTLLSMAFAFAALATGGLNAAEVDFTFTEGTGNATKYPIPIEIDDVTFIYEGGSNTGKWYSGDEIRIYASEQGSFTVSVPNEDGYAITSVTLTRDDSATLTPNTGTLSGSDWTSSDANTKSVTFTAGGTGRCDLQKVHVVYDKPAVTELTAPEISGVENGVTYYGSVVAEISYPELATSLTYVVTKDGVAGEPQTATSAVELPISDPGSYKIEASATNGSTTLSATPVEFTISNLTEVVWMVSGASNGALSAIVTNGEGTWNVSGAGHEGSLNGGAQLGSGGSTFDGTISLTNSSIPANAQIQKITLVTGTKASGSPTFTVNATVNGNPFGEAFTCENEDTGGTTHELTGEVIGNNIVFTVESTGNGYFLLKEIRVLYEVVDVLLAPGFSGVAEGASYWDEATVEIACATEGATINYTVTKDDVADEPVTGAASPVSVKLTEPGRYTVTATASKDSETSEEASISFTIAAFPYDRLDPNGEIKEGTYMIVAADETGQYYMMKNAVQSNFYVQATVFDFEAGVPTTDETCLFFVEKADGGYYIKNFDQTYVSLVETMGADNKMHTNLKPAEATPFVWTFSGTKDAVVATGTEITVPMGFQMYKTTPEFAAGNDYTKPMFFYVNNETSGVEETMAGGVAVAGVDGAIAVAADEAVSVAVYTAAGQLAVSTEVAAGTTELSVAPGFYIVKAGDVVKKVIVK